MAECRPVGLIWLVFHQSALKDFQDNFYYDVASRHGLMRYGKKR